VGLILNLCNFQPFDPPSESCRVGEMGGKARAETATYSEVLGKSPRR